MAETLIPTDLKYSKEHEWIKIEGKKVKIGITDYAQKSLGDIVYIDLPEVGSAYALGDSFGVIESVKAASDIYTPCQGKVSAFNDQLAKYPEVVNTDPYGQGWMVELQEVDESQLHSLMDAAAYAKFVEGLEGE